MAYELGVLLATPPPISSRSPQATGGRTAGTAALAMTASRTGPLESSGYFPGDEVTDGVQRNWQLLGAFAGLLGSEGPRTGVGMR